MRSLSPSLFIFLIFVTGASRAEEKAADPTAPMPKDQKEYIDKTGRLTSLTNRIEARRKEFAEAVHNKNTASTALEKQRWIHAMNEIHASLNKDIESHQRIKSELKLRYPHQGETIERRYKTQSKKTVEEMEGVAGLDEKLTDVKKVIEKKYEPFRIEEEKKNPGVALPSPSTPEEKPTRLRLEK